MNTHVLFYYLGIAIIFFTHIFMLTDTPSMRNHALINLFAGACIAYYFMWKEGFIRF